MRILAKELYLQVRPFVLPGRSRGYLRFVAAHRRLPKLHNPQTFSDKVMWKIRNDRRPILCTFCDKFGVREYVAQRIGEEFLPKLYYVTDDPNSIPWHVLPLPCVIKATHGSGWNRFILSHADLQPGALIRECKKWLRRNYYDFKGEWSYRNVPRRILAEEFLDAGDGRRPFDFKFFVFDGRVEFLLLDVDRFGDHRKNFYTRDWQLLESVTFGYEQTAESIVRPSSLTAMIEIAECLSKKIDMVRVDLYNIRGRIVFGELTNYPLAGARRFSPITFDLELGSKWNLQQRRIGTR